MSRVLRRFEVLLPLRLSDSTAVPDYATADTLTELEVGFGAFSCELRRGSGETEGVLSQCVQAEVRDDRLRVLKSRTTFSPQWGSTTAP